MLVKAIILRNLVCVPTYFRSYYRYRHLNFWSCLSKTIRWTTWSNTSSPLSEQNSASICIGLLLSPVFTNPDWLEDEIIPAIGPFLKGRDWVAPSPAVADRIGPRISEWDRGPWRSAPARRLQGAPQGTLRNRRCRSLSRGRAGAPGRLWPRPSCC